MFLVGVFVFMLGVSEVQPILDPVSYGAATIATASGARVASLLVVHVDTIQADALSQGQRMIWDDLAARVRVQYAGSDRRQRARLTAEVFRLGGVGSMRSDDSVWLRFPDGEVTHAERQQYPHSGTIWRLTDGGSGQYLAVVRSGDTSELTPLFKELFKHHSDDVAASIREKGAQLETQIEGLVEVNGQRQYLAKGTATPAALAAEMVALFPNLYGDGKQRILQSLALLEAFREGGIKAQDPDVRIGAMLCAAPCDPAGLPLPTVPNTLQVRMTAHRPTFLEPPDEAVVTEFFGRKGWPRPDLTRDFKEQVRKLLSASD